MRNSLYSRYVTPPLLTLTLLRQNRMTLMG